MRVSKPVRYLVAGIILGFLPLIAAFVLQVAAGPKHDDGHVMPAASTPPPEVVETDRLRAGDTELPGERATAAQLTLLLAKQEGMAERMARANAGGAGAVFPASGRVPPHVLEREGLLADAERQSPSSDEESRTGRKQLVEQIRRQPGAAEAVERAEAGQGPAAQAALRRAVTSLLDLGPLGSRAAEAGADLSMSVSAANGVAGLRMETTTATLLMEATGWVSHWTPKSMIYLNSWARGWANGRTSRQNCPWVHVGFQAPETGWYIVNIYAIHTAPFLLQHYESGTGYVQIQTFAPPSGGGVDCPSLVYLAAGWHHFYYVLDNTDTGNTTGYARVYRATVDSYP